ncbi:MAG: serine/threonine-protein kinase [Myxococcota bacterium]|nr:serine/threonine-protein kinase [Myxococcota bacterium]
MAQQQIPKQLGRYNLVRPISKGGMATIYEARRNSIAGISPKVAIKIIDPKQASNEAFKKLFINEALVSSNLRHKNLIQIQDFNEDAGYYYLVMEFVDGLTLRHLFKTCRKHGLMIPQSLVAEIGRQICEGLHHAHQASTPEGIQLGLVHRDIKPSNVMIDGRGVIKVVDFGVSLAGIAQERPGAIRGTWGYMSPEQASGQPLTLRSDVFSLGIVLYELISLQPMFPNRQNTAQIKKLLQGDEAARMIAKLPKDYKEIKPLLMRALQRDPEARFATAEDMGKALSGLSSDLVRAREDLIFFYKKIKELRENPKRKGLPFEFFQDKSQGSNYSTNVFGFLSVILVGAIIVLVLYFVFSGLVGNKKQTPEVVQESSPPTIVEPTPTEVIVETKTETVTNTPVVKQTKTKTKIRAKKKKQKVEPTKKTEVKALGYGQVTISADVTSRVYIDGKFVRSAPLVKHKLPLGKHRFTIANENGDRKNFSFTVQDGYFYLYQWSFYDNSWKWKKHQKMTNPR